MEIVLDPMTLGESSTVRAQFFLGRTPWGRGWQILVVRYSGVCRSGLAGEHDSRHMYAMAQAGDAAWQPGGIILDFTELEFDVSNLGPHPSHRFFWMNHIGDPEVYSPHALIIGTNDRTACLALFGDQKPHPGLEERDYVFRDLPTAWDYVFQEVGEQWTVFNRPPKQ